MKKLFGITIAMMLGLNMIGCESTVEDTNEVDTTQTKQEEQISKFVSKHSIERWIMIKNLISILDFGSSRITILCGVGDVNNSFRLLASVDTEYEGFSKGEFIDSNNLQPAIARALRQAEEELQCKIDNVFVGVPAEFCYVYDAMLTKTFPKKTKITNKIIDALFMEDKEDNPYKSHTIINKAPLFYIVNDDNKTNDPTGLIVNKLQARTSYVLVENGFKLLVSGILESLGVKRYDFLSNSLAESLYLIDDYRRNGVVWERRFEQIFKDGY